jgi:hypothetical protein
MKPVDILQAEYLSIVGFLNSESQPSLASDVNKYFRKVFVLSAASYFEHLIQDILLKFIKEKTNDNAPALNFFKKKAIGMQYHTYFSWGEKDDPDRPGKNANTFFSLFGEDFKKNAESRIASSAPLEKAMRSFLEVGHLRNILVHSNFAAYSFENKTTEEIYDLYKEGLIFVNFIDEILLTKV